MSKYDARIHATVAEWQKEEWEEAVAESDEYDSLSDLVRAAVPIALADENPAKESDNVPAELNDTLGGN